MTRAKYGHTCAACGRKIDIGMEIADAGARGWIHAECVTLSPPPPAARFAASCPACWGTHIPDVQERINARGALKIRAAMRGEVGELDRLAALPATCGQSAEAWYQGTYDTVD